MFDRLSNRAKKTMNLARQCAQRFNHEYLGAEHILWGISELPDSRGMTVLRDFGIDAKAIQERIERGIKTGPSMVTMGQLPFTPRAKRALEKAMEEAQNYGTRLTGDGSRSKEIGTEHVLVGLVSTETPDKPKDIGLAAEVLVALGATPGAVRERTRTLTASEAAKTAEEPSDNAPPATASRGRLVLEIEVPAGASDAEIAARAREAALLANEVHRGLGGDGLEVQSLGVWSMACEEVKS